jgi:anti-sigma factor RsiW
VSPLRILSPRDLACREVVALLTDYLDGALSSRQRRRLERHLAGCPHCSEFLTQLQDTIRASALVDVDAIDDATRDDLLDLYRRWRQE